MFFDDLSAIPRLATRSATTVFAVPPKTPITLKNALVIEKLPDKKFITIEQIRQINDFAKTKETRERFIIIRQAEQLSAQSSNALLKLLEEPKEHYHFLLITDQPYALLLTILSRAELYLYRTTNQLSQAPQATPAVLDLAKQILAATARDLPALADQIAKHKPEPREFALDIAATATELAYKSFFATQNPKFLTKIPQLITLHQNLQLGGNLKLHIVADLC